jgi:hypothetical protein
VNINKLIQEFLESKGCKLEIEAGMIVVRTPDGEVWDLTIPFEIGRYGRPPKESTEQLSSEVFAKNAYEVYPCRD